MQVQYSNAGWRLPETAELLSDNDKLCIEFTKGFRETYNHLVYGWLRSISLSLNYPHYSPDRSRLQ